MRTVILMVLGAAVGVVGALALYNFGPRNTGVTVAVVAAVVLGVGLMNAARR